MSMNRHKWETAFVCAVHAVEAALGIYFGTLFFFHIDPQMCDPGKAWAIFVLLTGSIWGILLFRKY